MKQISNTKTCSANRTKHYWTHDPWTLRRILFMMLILLAVSVVFYFIWKILLMIICAAAFAVLLLFVILTEFTWVRIDGSGVTFYLGGLKKHSIRWDDVYCSGYFYHFVYIDKKAKYYYFIRKPIHWKTDPLGITNMPRITKDLILVADQRDLEQVLREYYPKVFR